MGRRRNGTRGNRRAGRRLSGGSPPLLGAMRAFVRGGKLARKSRTSLFGKKRGASVNVARTRRPRSPREGSFAAGIGLMVMSAISMLAAMTEPSRWWRVGEVFSSAYSVLAAFAVWLFGLQPWVSVPIQGAMLLSIITGGRLEMRAGRRKR